MGYSSLGRGRFVCGVRWRLSSLIIVNNLPSQVAVRKNGHGSAAEINLLLVDGGNWNLRIIRTDYCHWGGRSKKMVVWQNYVHCCSRAVDETMSCRLQAHPDSESDSESDAYSAIAPPETPMSLRCSL